MRSDQVALSFIKSGLENIQGWKLHNLYGQTVPLLGCPHGRLLGSSEAVFSSLSSQGKSSTLPDYLASPELHPVYQYIFCIGDPQLDEVSQMQSNECQVKRDNDFPQPADCALVKTADPKHLLQNFSAEACS